MVWGSKYSTLCIMMIVRNEALNCHAQVGREENFLEVERKIQHYLAATLLP